MAPTRLGGAPHPPLSAGGIAPSFRRTVEFKRDIRPLLQRAGRKFNQVCGGMFMAMGVALPMTR